MPANDIGIDMGTSSCLVYSTGKGLILKEPTVVVYDKDTEKIKAIGEEAKQMAGHASSNIEVIRPIRQGVITDFIVMEKMLKYFIPESNGTKSFSQTPHQHLCAKRDHGDRAPGSGGSNLPGWRTGSFSGRRTDRSSNRGRRGHHETIWKSDR